MRSVDILTTAIGNTFRSRLRTTLTVIAIFIGAFTLTITNGLGTGINNYIDTQLGSIGAPDVLTVTKPTETTDTEDGPAKYDPDAASEVSADGPPGTTVLAMTQDDLDAIADIGGVNSVEPVLSVRPDYVEWQDNGKYEISVSEFSAGMSLDLAAGDGFETGSAAAELVVPTTYVEPLGFDSNEDAIGETVTVAVTDATRVQHTVEATIVGVQEPALFGTGSTMNDALSAELYDLQSIGLPESVTSEYGSATARVAADLSHDELAAIRADIEDAGYASTTVADQIGSIQTVIDGIILVLNAFAIIALLAAGFGIINTLLMSVQERTREIGLMKAMGMSSGRIFGLFSTEAVFIGFLGSAIGAGIGMLVGGLVSGVLADGLLAGLAGLQIIAFDPVSIGSVLLLVMGIAFVAAVLPASRAARQSPIDSLRYE